MENNQPPQIEHRDKNKLIINAPAKINLSLLIGPKRDDGYHQVHTVMAKINLCDRLTLQKTKNSKIDLSCKGQYPAPQTPENLVCKAARILGIEKGLKITLEKNIPPGAGLAGGSSDAAATMTAVNQLFNLGLTDNQLMEKAALIGSDIAFFVGPPLALCTSRGEKIKKINNNYDFDALLLLPNVNCSTKEVYKNFNPDIKQYEQKKIKINEHIGKNRIDLITKMCANMLQSSCFELYPKIADLKSKVESLIPASVCLSGSGSAIYAVPENDEIINIYNLKRILQQKLNCTVMLVSNNRW